MHSPDFRGVILELSVRLGLISDHQTVSAFLVMGFVLNQNTTLGRISTGTDVSTTEV